MNNEIISKDDLYNYLNSVIINKDNLLILQKFYEDTNSANFNTKQNILYLLYNEYASFKDIQKIQTEDYSTIFESKYGNMRKTFVRDLCPTLLYSRYGSSENIINQLKVVDATFTDDEISKIKFWIGDASDNSLSIHLVRHQTDNGIDLSNIESNTNSLSKCSADLNSHDSNVRKIAKNIFNKIITGTIH